MLTQPQSTTREHEGESVLVVEGDEAHRALARCALTDAGYRVLTATTGEEALASFRHHRPDCVLLAVKLPDIDGVTICRRIRALAGGEEAQIVFLTGVRDVETFDEALDAGADDFLTKPVRPTDLVGHVRAVFAYRTAPGPLRESYLFLRRQRHELVRLELQKERLITFVVHDLKNPVNSMDLYAQLLLREKGVSEMVRDAATHVRSEARQLNRMILSLLDLSKADEGHLDVRRTDVDLAKLVTEVFNELDVLARESNIRLRCGELGGQLRADPDLLRRMLANLVENAVRHAPRNTVVTVSASHTPGEWEIDVSDQGPGVPPELREHIFEPFVQLDNADQMVTRNGRGLGLAFCKQVALAHGGSIRVEDASPGSMFCVRLAS